MEISEHLSIPDIEKENLNFLAEIIYGLTDGESDLEVVGGAVTKQWPRPDIDIIITMSEGEGDTELKRAEARLKDLERLVQEIEKSSNGYFKKQKVIHPYSDSRYDDPDNILEHEGSIRIKPQKGTVLEIVPIS